MSKPAILHIAAWWPEENRPLEGVFIKEHIDAIAGATRSQVVHLRIAKSTGLWKPRMEVRERKGFDYPVTEMDIRTPVRRFGLHNRLVRAGFRRLLREAVQRHGKPDIVHVHVRDHLSRHLLSQRLLEDVPWVHSEHFSFYHRGIHLLTAKEKGKEVREIQRWFAGEKLKKIVPVSEELRSVLIEDFGAPEAKTTVVPNIANPVFGPPAQFCPSRSIVLAAGWYPPKDLPVFFEALSSLSPDMASGLTVQVFGEGPQLEALKKQVASQGLPYKLEFQGFQSKAVIAVAVQNALLVCHPTTRENLPAIIAEALCCGTPVVSMRVNGIPEMVDDSNGLLVPPEDPKALTRALETAIRENGRFDRKSIAENARNTYAPERVAAQLISIYQQVLEDA